MAWWAKVRRCRRRGTTTALKGSAVAGADVWFLDPGDAERRPRLGWGHQKRTAGGESFTLRPFNLGRSLLVDWGPINEHALTADATVHRDAEMVDDARGRRRSPPGEDRGRRRTPERGDLDRPSRSVRAAQRKAARQARHTAAVQAAQPSPTRPAHLPSSSPSASTTAGRTTTVYVPGPHRKAALVVRLFDRDRFPAVVGRSAVVTWLKQSYRCDDSVGRPVADLLHQIEAVGAVRLDAATSSSKTPTTVIAGSHRRDGRACLLHVQELAGEHSDAVGGWSPSIRHLGSPTCCDVRQQWP